MDTMHLRQKLLDRLSRTSVKELPTEIVGMSKNNLHVFTQEPLNSNNVNNFDAGDRYIIVNDMSNTDMTDSDESIQNYKKSQRKKYYRSKLLYLSL